MRNNQILLKHVSMKKDFSMLCRALFYFTVFSLYVSFFLNAYFSSPLVRSGMPLRVILFYVLGLLLAFVFTIRRIVIYRSRRKMATQAKKLLQILEHDNHSRQQAKVQEYSLFSPPQVRIQIKKMYPILLLLVLFGSAYIFSSQVQNILLNVKNTQNALQDPLIYLTNIINILFFVLLVLLCILALFFFHESISADETGIVEQGDRTPILWQEAQWFVCYRTSRVSKRSTIFFHLITAEKTLIWRKVKNPLSWLSLWKPTTPMKEYHQRMQALIAYISARTGLPLYDLSGPEPIQIYPPLEQMEVALPQEQQKEDERATDLEK